MFVKTAQEFGREVMQPAEIKLDQMADPQAAFESELFWDVMQQAFDLGFHKMGIKEEYHGLGLGGMLLEALEQLLERKAVTTLIASTLSYTVKYKPFEKVRAFYYQKGFKSLGIQNDYYDDGVDRLVLLNRIS